MQWIFAGGLGNEALVQLHRRAPDHQKHRKAEIEMVADRAFEFDTVLGENDADRTLREDGAMVSKKLCE